MSQEWKLHLEGMPYGPCKQREYTDVAKGSICGLTYTIRRWDYASVRPKYDVRVYHGKNNHHDIPFNESLHDALSAARVTAELYLEASKEKS